jgi:hypothetical protein
MDNYTFLECADKHLVLGEAHGNGAAAVMLYAGRYPQHRLLNACMFHAIDCCIRKTGIVCPSTVDGRRFRNAGTIYVEVHILGCIKENTCTSVCRIQAAKH